MHYSRHYGNSVQHLVMGLLHSASGAVLGPGEMTLSQDDYLTFPPTGRGGCTNSGSSAPQTAQVQPLGHLLTRYDLGQMFKGTQFHHLHTGNEHLTS